MLIVNGFDRLDRYLNPRQAYGTGEIDRVWPEKSNSFDYAVQTAEAMENYDAPLRISTAANECVIGGSVQLADYDAVVWILGEESTTDRTFTATEQTLVATYLAGGGNLFLSGSEIGYELVGVGHGASFYQTTLHANYVSDDAGTYAAQGAAGSIFEGCAVTFDNGSQFYDVDYPDVIGPRTGATTAMTYSGGTGGGAAIQYENTTTGSHLVMLGFPFETITTAANRADGDASRARLLPRRARPVAGRRRLQRHGRRGGRGHSGPALGHVRRPLERRRLQRRRPSERGRRGHSGGQLGRDRRAIGRENPGRESAGQSVDSHRIARRRDDRSSAGWRRP